MFKNMWSKFAAKIVQPDPKPEPSILDILDSRGTVPLDDDGDIDTARAIRARQVAEAQQASLLALRERLMQPDEDDWTPVHFDGGMKVTTEHDRIAAYYARVTEVQKRSAWS